VARGEVEIKGGERKRREKRERGAAQPQKFSKVGAYDTDTVNKTFKQRIHTCDADNI